MKMLFSILLLTATGLSGAGGLSVDELNEAFTEKSEAVSVEKISSLAKLEKGYLGRLTKLKARFQKDGKLENMELIEAEEGHILSQKWPMPRLKTSHPANLKTAREIYDKARYQIEKKAATATLKINEVMIEALKKKKVDATKAGQLTEAKKAKTLGATVSQSKAFNDARQLIAAGDPNSKGPPALRVRRYGDDIEVLVRRDINGKISMESPVENVIEETGESAQKGDLEVKVLGEFLGAKGYTVAPRISYRQTFNHKKNTQGAFAISGFKQTLPFTSEGRKGLKMEVSPKLATLYGAIPNTLSPKSVGGKFRLTCSYYIPQSNRVLKGFEFHHGSGFPLADHSFDMKGQWVDKTIEADSRGLQANLYFYPELAEGKKGADAVGDYLVLGHLSVEQIRFSAYLHTRFDNNGDALETFTNPADQKMIAQNGIIIAQ